MSPRPPLAVTLRRWVAAAIALLAIPAWAHVPIIRGRLVEMVRSSDIILIGLVEETQPIGVRRRHTTVRPISTLVGSLEQPLARFLGATHFKVGGRYVLFLRKRHAEFVEVEAAGAVFNAEPADDETYRQTITGIAGASTSADLFAALIRGLSATARELRYHAALELNALAHRTRVSAAQQQSLAQLVASPTTDEATRTLLLDALQTMPAREEHSVDGSHGD